MGYETPNYERLMKKKDFEVRRYPSFQIIQYENPEDAGAVEGFRTLFQYIGAKNQENRKIPMTVPVLQNKGESNNRMSFVLPKSIKNPPQPVSPYLTISTVPGGIYVVHRYRGSHSKAKYLKHENILRKILKQRHYVAVGPFMAAFYNPPFTPPFLKHNEVLVKIDPLSFQPIY